MPYEFECSKVVEDCDHKVRGETEDETLKKATAHITDAHDMADLPEDVAQTIRDCMVMVLPY